MDDKPSVSIPSEPASAAPETTPKKSFKKKTLLGFGGIFSILTIAVITFGILDITTGKQVSDTKPTPVIKEVDTPQSIDSKVQSDIDNELKVESQTSDAESQAVVDDMNATQNLEDNYDNL